MKLSILAFLVCTAAARSTQHGNRIVGGDVATRGQFPYQAGISIGGNMCSGALISNISVLTAAHCVSNQPSFEVHLGAQNISSTSEPGHLIISSQNATIHENFDISVNFDYDIAVIHLPYEVSGEYIASIRLPAWSQQNDNFTNEMAIITGWGTTADTNPWPSEVLRYATVRVNSKAECESYFSPEVITERQICSSTEGGLVSTCLGDSGVPLATTEEDAIPTLIGIANFGNPFGCFKMAKNRDTRIIGGNVADWGQFPYQAIAVAEDNATTGAVLISPSAVLTVAHFVARGELRYVEVRVTSLEECQEDWGNEVVTDINLCASTNYGTAGICVLLLFFAFTLYLFTQGDSGGPLALTEEDGEPTLVGTAIFGHPFGCEQDEANVYARVSKYLTWIANNVPDVIIRP
ncbi:hypothetical protein B566_EDAN008920 [Ephemera danica]|nr:hypothetical protein B566_EDAN008920 [Ephemera danica]